MNLYIFLCLLLLTASSIAQNLYTPGSPQGSFRCPLDNDSTHPVAFPYPNDCRKFYYCVGGIPYALNCPSNLYWSSITNSCASKQLSQCADINEKSIYYQPYPGDCNRYLEIHVSHCPENFHWNVLLQRCDLAVSANCKANPSTDPLPSVPGYTWSPFYSQSPANAPISVNPENSVIYPNLSSVDIIGLCQANEVSQYLPYPGDCHKFIHCGPAPSVQICPVNLFWNPKAMACDVSKGVCS